MIRTENLSMFYGPVRALNEVSFNVNKGEIIGLLGPNGAGKSTTLKILTTYIYPSQGTAYIADTDVRKDPISIRRMIGYLPEKLPLYTDMEVNEYLRFVGNARGLYGKRLRNRLEWVVEKCGLTVMYRKMIRELSKGYQQRTALSQALLHDPEIIILDEPTSGLDPHQILEIRTLIRELAKEKTIIFSTHILQEAEAISNRIIIINRGEIIANDTVGELRQGMKKERIELTLMDKQQQQVVEKLGSLDHVNTVTIKENSLQSEASETTYVLECDSKCQVQKALAELIQEKKWKFCELKKDLFTLEEIFLELTKPKKTTAEGDHS